MQNTIGSPDAPGGDFRLPRAGSRPANGFVKGSSPGPWVIANQRPALDPSATYLAGFYSLDPAVATHLPGPDTRAARERMSLPLRPTFPLQETVPGTRRSERRHVRQLHGLHR
jgi:hypothetical protein